MVTSREKIVTEKEKRFQSLLLHLIEFAMISSTQKVVESDFRCSRRARVETHYTSKQTAQRIGSPQKGYHRSILLFVNPLRLT